MNAKILCVDDEAEIRQDIAEELRDAGYDVLEAGDGRAGLDTILRQKPDLVVCDITMPVMDGHALLGELRQKHPEQAELPFVFLSALADRQHVLAGKRLGADDYLTKPIDYELLLVTIESRLDQVRRMVARKDEQLVKVYLAAQTAEAAPPEPAAAPAQPDAGRAASAGGPHPVRKTFAGSAGHQAQIQELAGSSGGRVVAGRVQVIGLDEIKASLGDRWAPHAERIRKIAEATIRQRLSEEDVLEWTEDQGFLICFASLSEREAAFKARAIGREVREKILGTEELDAEIRVNCEVTAEAHEIVVTPAEVAQSGDVLDLVMGRLQQAAANARQSERQTMAQIVDSCRIVQTRVATSQGKDAPVALADFDEAARAGVQALQRARPASDELAAEIDILRLARSAETLCQGALDAQPLLVVNVEFTTLESRRFLERYLQVCGSLTEGAKTHLAYNICNIPKGFLPTKVGKAANFVRPFGRLIMAELNDLSLASVDPTELRAPIVTCSFRIVAARLGKQPDALKQLAKEIHGRKARLLVYDVPAGEDTARLYSHGVDFAARRP